jgi:DNA-binding PadR family transcriptional regulator
MGPWGRRARRGDVRIALLLLLGEAPRNGYELMDEIEQRSGGAWRPSPGSVYPALARLREEGLVQRRDVEGRHVFELSEAGRERVGPLSTDPEPPWQRMRADVSDDAPDLHASLARLASAVIEVQRSGSHDQQLDAERQLEQTRRTLYRILADDPAGAESAL